MRYQTSRHALPIHSNCSFGISNYYLGAHQKPLDMVGGAIQPGSDDAETITSDFNTSNTGYRNSLFGSTYNDMVANINSRILTPQQMAGSNWAFYRFQYFELNSTTSSNVALSKIVSSPGTEEEETKANKYHTLTTTNYSDQEEDSLHKSRSETRIKR